MDNSIIALVGPTAVGKSKIGIELASRINAEIVSGDSMQVYCGMDVGTAKVKTREMYGSNGIYIKHHMIDIIPATQDYSVAEFQKDARICISKIKRLNKIPILLGGTGLYVRAVLDNYDFDVEVSHKTREKLKNLTKGNNNLELHQRLKNIDPLSAQRIHPNDLKRIIRALEYYETTGKLISSQNITSYNNRLYKPLIMIGLDMPRSILYERINNRVNVMLEEGLIEEVEKLLQSGVKPSNTSMQAIGYRQVVEYLQNKRTLLETAELIKRDTRRYAKRQLTWFRRDVRIKWYNLDTYNPFTIINQIKEEIGRNINI